MKLMLVVEFSVNESCGAMSPETPFKTVEDLRNYVSSQKEELMYSLEVNRSCYVSDKDLPTRKPEKHHGGHFQFFVSDKLIYPQDVQRYLQKNSVTKSLRIDNADKIKQDTPVLFRELVFYPMDTRSQIPQKKRNNSFEIRPLTEQDVVVDKNLNQIWPKNTGEAPVGLVELLAKQTEKVY